MAFTKDRETHWKILYYFRRGHGNYLSFLVSLTTFVVVVYQLAITNIWFLKPLFPSMWIFIIVFGMCYFLATVVIGWFDMKRGSYPAESKMSFDLNPRSREQYDTINRIEERLDRIEKKLEKKGKI
jgi:hypothetical protein